MPTAPRPSALLSVGVALLLAGVALGVWIALARGNEPFVVDAWWAQALAESRTSLLLVVSYAMNAIGGGWIGGIAVPLAAAGCLVLVRRPRAAVYFLAAELVSAGVVQVLKHALGRPRPEEIIVVSDFGSFPSGHVANAATIAVALWVVFPRALVLAVGIAWTALMAFTRTFLGAHWASDTLGGALVGAGIALLAAAALAPFLARERRGAPG